MAPVNRPPLTSPKNIRVPEPTFLREGRALDEGEEEIRLYLLLATNNYHVDQRVVGKAKTLHLLPPLAVKIGDGIFLVDSVVRLLILHSSGNGKLETGVAKYWKL